MNIKVLNFLVQLIVLQEFFGNSIGSYLWKIKTNPPSYIFGTLHVPYVLVWDDIPQNVKQAFHESQKVYLEVSFTKEHSTLKTCPLLPNNETLKSIIPTELYNRLEIFLNSTKNEFPSWLSNDKKPNSDEIFNSVVGNWERKRPMWVSFMLQILTKTMMYDNVTLG